MRRVAGGSGASRGSAASARCRSSASRIVTSRSRRVTAWRSRRGPAARAGRRRSRPSRWSRRVRRRLFRRRAPHGRATRDRPRGTGLAGARRRGRTSDRLRLGLERGPQRVLELTARRDAGSLDAGARRRGRDPRRLSLRGLGGGGWAAATCRRLGMGGSAGIDGAAGPGEAAVARRRRRRGAGCDRDLRAAAAWLPPASPGDRSVSPHVQVSVSTKPPAG